MVLAGHRRFREGGERSDREAPGSAGSGAVGRALLARAWAALESTRAESVDIQLRSGGLVRGVIAIRVDGQLADVSTRRGEWTHAFALEDVALVRSNPRGGT